MKVLAILFHLFPICQDDEQVACYWNDGDTSYLAISETSAITETGSVLSFE